MAEHVVQADLPRGASRVRELFARYPGPASEARGVPLRDRDALFDQLRAAKPRYRITRVTKHVCRHDEGVGDCSQTTVEG